MNHQRIDERSLAFGRLIADRLAADPDRWLAHARGNVARWLATCSPGVRPTLLDWDRALEDGLPAVLPLLTETDERSTRLRQSSPFAGMLSNAERTAVLLAFADHDTATT